MLQQRHDVRWKASTKNNGRNQDGMMPNSGDLDNRTSSVFIRLTGRAGLGGSGENQWYSLVTKRVQESFQSKVDKKVKKGKRQLPRELHVRSAPSSGPSPGETRPRDKEWAAPGARLVSPAAAAVGEMLARTTSR